MVAIDALPDDVLLEIFDFCVDQDPSPLFVLEDLKSEIEAWQALVHVCQRWRSVVFGSPLRLNLALVCTAYTPSRDTLDIWPPLPLVIWNHGFYRSDSNSRAECVDNITAVIKCSDRVCRIKLNDIPNSYLEPLLAAIHEPLPELTNLELRSYEGAVIPDSFLGGSAPRLQYISLYGIPFPGLPMLLISATHLVDLQLRNIPHSGYMSPEAIAVALSAATCLGSLILEFQSPRSFPDRENQRPPPLTRSVLPILTCFIFKGVTEYLENLVARIDAPRLEKFYVTFFNQIIFDIPQLIQFIHRTPTLKALERADVIFGEDAARVKLSSVSSLAAVTSGYREFNLKVPCRDLDWQVSSLEQVCTSSLPPLSTLEDLYIYKGLYSRPIWKDNIENALWLELLHSFPAVKNLYLCQGFAPRIIPAFQELVGFRTTDVLPTLRNIFVEELKPSGSIQEGIQQFIATRQVTGHPIAVSRWDHSECDKSWKGVGFHSRFY